MRRKNDILLKSAFEEAFSDLLRFFFDDADSLFDIEKGLEFMDKELHELFPDLEKQGGSRFVDMLAKIYGIDGAEEWILIHIEIQAQNDQQFSKRMFQYFYRIYDRYNMPVTALAVFTGAAKSLSESTFHYRFLGTELVYKYNNYHIMDHSEEQLLVMDNPFALIVLAAQKALLADKIPEWELAEHRLTIARALIGSKKYSGEKVKRFLYFLKTFIHIENHEINSKFDNEISQLTGNESTMGIIETIKMLTREEGIEIGLEQGLEKGLEQGLEKGEEKKSLKVVTRMLQSEKFSISEIANFADVSEDFVRKVQEEIK
ncbi:hypothetical protein IEE83_04825 [Dyadobacter sp. UP-52]|uniref:Transposase (putative) YhgA-like domain-containing protein n=1 Tax=Dyadobacter subterraneus TaxID=2773304 RepID=A0ABR9W6X6_9BACT|nr:hypothetical protein [Dyadobacter subterraneus]